MATSSSIRNGRLWSMVAGSNEAIGGGGSLLNHNFIELYDMVRPAMEATTPTVRVPTMDQESNTDCYGRTINVPNPANASLSYSNYYVPVMEYTGGNTGNITWMPYVSSSSDTTSSSDNDSVPEVSELTRASEWGFVWQYTGSSPSYWDGYSSDMGKFQKTYTLMWDYPYIEIKLPAFGVWFVTGTLIFIHDVTTESQSKAQLYRINIFGRDTSVKNVVVEYYSSGTWSDAGNDYGRYITTNVTNSRLRITNQQGGNHVLAALTLVGGSDAKLGSSNLDMYISSGS